MSTTITQCFEDFQESKSVGKPLDIIIKEQRSQLHRRRISEEDKIVAIKRTRRSKHKKYKNEIRYFHGTFAHIIIDEAWNLLNKKQNI